MGRRISGACSRPWLATAVACVCVLAYVGASVFIVTDASCRHEDDDHRLDNVDDSGSSESANLMPEAHVARRADDDAQEGLDWSSLSAWTGRKVRTVMHPWGAHDAAFALHRCGDRPRWGDAEVPASAAACLCGPAAAAATAIAPGCMPPVFDPRDLAYEDVLQHEQDAAGPTEDLDQRQMYNVVIVSLDSARADAFPFNARPLPPAALAALAHTPARAVQDRHVAHPTHPAVVFCNAFAGAPWSAPAHAALLTGVPADATGVFDDDHVLRVPQLGHHLAATYCRIAHVSNSNLMPDPAAAATADLYATSRPLRTFGWNGTGAWDEYTYHADAFAAVAEAEAFLRTGPSSSPRRQQEVVMEGAAGCRGSGDQPWLLFVHVNHIERYSSGSGGGSSGDAEQYAARVAETDMRVARLLDHVDFATTIVLLVSDHGEGFEPHLGRVRHTGRVDDDLLRMSLVVWHPLGPGTVGAAWEQESNRWAVEDTPVSAISIVPTVLSWLGYSVPPYLVGPRLSLHHHHGDGQARTRVQALAAVPVTAVDRDYAWVSPATRRKPAAGPTRGGHYHGRPTDGGAAVGRVVAWRPTAADADADADACGASARPGVNPRRPHVGRVEVRMTLRWPLKLVTAVIGQEIWHAAYNLSADPGETNNLLSFP